MWHGIATKRQRIKVTGEWVSWRHHCASNCRRYDVQNVSSTPGGVRRRVYKIRERCHDISLDFSIVSFHISYMCDGS